MWRNRATILAFLLASGCAAGSDGARLELRAAGGSASTAYGSGGAYAAGKRHLADGKIGLAIDAFRQALRADPTSVRALNGLAVAYDRIGRFDVSRRYYEQALSFEPGSAELLNNLGYSLLMQGRGAEARPLLERAGRSGDPAVQATAGGNLGRIQTTGQGVAQAPAPEPAVTAPTGWVERTNAHQQTLVTRPRAELVALAAARQLEPRLISANRGPERAAEITLTPGAITELALAGPEVTATPEHRALTVWNGVGRERMAARAAQFLRAKAIRVGRLADTPGFGRRSSELRYGPADRPTAVDIAATLPFTVRLHEVADADGIHLVLGRNALAFDNRLAGRRERS